MWGRRTLCWPCWRFATLLFMIYSTLLPLLSHFSLRMTYSEWCNINSLFFTLIFLCFFSPQNQHKNLRPLACLYHRSMSGPRSNAQFICHQLLSGFSLFLFGFLFCLFSLRDCVMFLFYSFYLRLMFMLILTKRFFWLFSIIRIRARLWVNSF